MVPKICSVPECECAHKARGFCGRHYAEWRRQTPASQRIIPAREDRFWERVDTSAGPTSCWPWTATVTENGYGQFHDGFRIVKAHRFAYETTNGPIDDGLVADHTCHNDSSCTDVPCAHRKCCNPAHLEPTTQRINSIRGRSGDHQSAKTACPKGHPYSLENTIIRNGRGHRLCRTCNRATQARYNAKRKAA